MRTAVLTALTAVWAAMLTGEARGQMVERKLRHATDPAATHLFLENPAARVSGPTRVGIMFDLHHSVMATGAGDLGVLAGYAAAAVTKSMGAGLGLGLGAQHGRHADGGTGKRFIAQSLTPRMVFELTKATSIGLKLTHVTFSSQGAPIIDRDGSDYTSGYVTAPSFGIQSQGKWSWELAYRRQGVGKGVAGEQRITALPWAFNMGFAHESSSSLRWGAGARGMWFDETATEAVVVAVENEQGFASPLALTFGADVKGDGKTWHISAVSEYAGESWAQRLSLSASFFASRKELLVGGQVLVREANLTDKDLFLAWSGDW